MAAFSFLWFLGLRCAVAIVLGILPFALEGAWASASASLGADWAPHSMTSAEEASVPTIIVHASRLPAKSDSSFFNEALAQSTHFDTQDLDDRGAADVAELLPLAAGMQIVRAGGVGAASSMYLRGADAAQTLVLLDGVRIDSASLGRAQLSLALLDHLEQVDVVNGNVSALYGGGAVGGVVQLRSRQELPLSFNGAGANNALRSALRMQAATSYGRYGTQHQRLGVSKEWGDYGDTQFYLGISRMKTAGFSAMDPTQVPGINPDPNGASNHALNVSLQRQFDEGWEAGLRLYDTRSIVSFDQPFGLSTDQHFSHNRLRVFSASAQGPLNKRWVTHILVAHSEDGNINTQNHQFNSQFDTRNDQLTWRNEIRLSPSQKGVWGYEHLDQSLKASVYTTPGSTPPTRRVDSAFAGYVLEHGAHEMQFHARQDQYSDVGVARSVYAGYRYFWSPQWQTAFSASNAFRAPSFNDLYYPDYGNSSVQPERSHSFEATVRHQGGATLGGDTLETDARLSAFQTRYRDLIESVQVSPGIYRARNIGRAKVQGLEMAAIARWRESEWRVTGTIQNPLEEARAVSMMPRLSRDLPRRARHFGSLTFSAPIAQWRVGGDWMVNGRREDGNHPLHGYALFHLHARHALSPNWLIRARIENLLNRHYQLAYGYQTPARGAYLELVWNAQ